MSLNIEHNDRKLIRLEIPHPSEHGCKIVGVLEQLQGGERDKEGDRKIALILHGVAGHKDYLFQKKIAKRLPMDSFRFDFRGNHETLGTWSQGGLENDLEDLRAVVAYLSQSYGYVVDLVVGHSRGSIVGFRWMCEMKDSERVPTGYVNVSGRYRMNLIWESPTMKAATKAFEQQRQQNPNAELEYIWTPTVARKQMSYRITPSSITQFASWDNSRVWTDFPEQTDVLTIHGLKDAVVSAYDAVLYSRALGSRSGSGTHSLELVEEADHNFTGMGDGVVDVILEWWREKERGTLKTGVWGTGLKGKL